MVLSTIATSSLLTLEIEILLLLNGQNVFAMMYFLNNFKGMLKNIVMKWQGCIYPIAL